jgi:putative ABC transport system permease protein
VIPRWRRASLRWLLRHPWQLGLAFVGVALGVAVVVAVDLATGSAGRAFELSMERVTGDATHRIVGPPRGLDEDFYRELRIERGVRASAPVIEGFAELRGETLRVLGLDPLAGTGASGGLADVRGDDLSALITEPDRILLAAPTARRHDIAPGDTIDVGIAGRMHALRVVGLIEGEQRGNDAALDGLAVADIANAQTWFDRVGRIDYIDLAIDAATAERLADDLPAGLRLESTATRNRQAREMTSAFRTNLTAMGLLAVVVGVFLIYNTMTFTVVQRRRLIGTLRALGATRGMIFSQIVFETLLLGAAGTLVGLLAGIVLAHGLVHLVTRTINDLYFVLTVRELFIDAGVLAQGTLVGLVAALAGALGPAAEAAGSPPDTGGRRSVLERRTHALVPRLALAGGAILALGGGALLLPGGGLTAGYFALCALIVGAACVIPLILRVTMPPLARGLGRLFGPLARMAAAGIPAALSRTALAVIALTIALSATVGVGVMIDSFRGTVAAWLERTLAADLYLSGPDRVAARHSAALPEGLAERVRGVDGVGAISTGWRIEVESGRGPTPLMALDPAPGSLDAIRLRDGEPASVWPRFTAGEAVLVTESWTRRHDAGVGDTIRLQTSRGWREVPIAGVYYDYNTDRGIVLMHRGLYDRWWRDDPISSIGVFLADGADIDTVTDRIRTLLRDTGPVDLNRSGDIRRLSLEVFDRTFAITGVLRGLALVVAFVGVLTALLALQLERGRELAILRATGATPGQIRAHVLGQSGLIGLSAGVLAIPLGLALAEVLIHVINQRAFGWSIATRIPPLVMIEALGLALAAALLAGAWPAWRAGRVEPAAALREE